MKKKFFRFVFALLLSFTYLAVLPANDTLAGFENFLTWTEVDGGDDVVISQYQVTWADEARSAVNYVYNDLGTGYLDGSFQVTFQANCSSSTAGDDGATYWAVSNSLGTWKSLYIDSGDDILGFAEVHPSSPNELRWYLRENAGATQYASSDYFIPTGSTTYYISIIRDETIGAYGQLQAYIYDDYIGGNEVDTLTLNLHEKVDFRYIFAHQSYGNAGAYTFSGLTAYMELTELSLGDVPLVITTFSQSITGAMRLAGFGSTNNGALLTKGFQVGAESGNYTDNYTGTFLTGDTNYFIVDLTSDNLTAGETYYFRAYASNSYGTGYGFEHSFIAAFQHITILTSEAIVEEQANGKYSASFDYFVTPNNVTTAYGRMSTSANFSTGNIPDSDLRLYITAVLRQGQGQYSYMTFNSVNGSGILSANTTYYYQGYIVFEEQTYYGKVKSFTTPVSTLSLPDKPVVNIISLRDVHEIYMGTYLFEFKAQAVTSNNTDIFYTQGFEFSLYQDESAGVLLPTIYSWTCEINADNTFTVVMNLDTATWYSGETIYVRAFVNTLRYGKVYSRIASINPLEENLVGGGTGGDGSSTTSTVQTINDTFRQIRAGLGLFGIMGTWVFMGLLLIIVSLVFGIAFFIVNTPMGKTAIGFTWLLVSVSVVGGFIFTGELGVWPILILVGSFVALIIIVLSVKLSGGNSINA